MKFLNEGIINEVAKALATIIHDALETKGYEIKLRKFDPYNEQSSGNQEERVQELAIEIMKRM